MKIIISDRAKEDISNIYNYLVRYSTKYANNTVNNIYEIIYSIKDFPYIGRYVHEIPNKRYRERIYKKYRIIYYISEKNKTIYIQYILSSRQNIKQLLKLYIKDLFQFLI